MSDTPSKFWNGFSAAFQGGRYARPEPELHELSVGSVMLNMHFGEQILAKGTGWFWRLRDGLALVTAWHNFSGLHHTKRTAISSHGGVPDRVKFRYLAKMPQTFQDAEIPLYIDDDPTKPRWFVHPVCGSFFDMAFLRLDLRGGDVVCINDSVSSVTGGLRPGAEVFAVGFPQGVGTLGVFAVWKRGSVATDPDISVEGHPKFFADMAGRGGLSGAPVYRVQRGAIVEATTNGQSVSFGEKIEFVGLYSGRVADQLPPEARSGESTDLGFVWRAELVHELLDSGVLDEQPEIGKGSLIIEETWDSP